jgi:hypothetical protein
MVMSDFIAPEWFEKFRHSTNGQCYAWLHLPSTKLGTEIPEGAPDRLNEDGSVKTLQEYTIEYALNPDGDDCLVQCRRKDCEAGRADAMPDEYFDLWVQFSPAVGITDFENQAITIKERQAFMNKWFAPEEKDDE